MRVGYVQQIAWNTVISLYLFGSPVQCVTPMQIKQPLLEENILFPSQFHRLLLPQIYCVVPLPGLYRWVSLNLRSCSDSCLFMSLPHTFTHEEIELKFSLPVFLSKKVCPNNELCSVFCCRRSSLFHEEWQWRWTFTAELGLDNLYRALRILETGGGLAVVPLFYFCGHQREQQKGQKISWKMKRVILGGLRSEGEFHHWSSAWLKGGWKPAGCKHFKLEKYGLKKCRSGYCGESRWGMIISCCRGEEVQNEDVHHQV